MKTIILIAIVMFLISCGYHLRSQNSLSKSHSNIKLTISAQSPLKRDLVSALLASGVKLDQETSEHLTELKIVKDSLRKVVQSIGANNQIQEYRLEYDVQYGINDGELKSVHLERDYSFDIQQIGGGQQEEVTLRKQMVEDMAWAIIRQINASINQKTNQSNK